MPPMKFETTISAGERPQTYFLDRAATGNGFMILSILKYFNNNNRNYCIKCLLHLLQVLRAELNSSQIYEYF